MCALVEYQDRSNWYDSIFQVERVFAHLIDVHCKFFVFSRLREKFIVLPPPPPSIQSNWPKYKLNGQKPNKKLIDDGELWWWWCVHPYRHCSQHFTSLSLFVAVCFRVVVCFYNGIVFEHQVCVTRTVKWVEAFPELIYSGDNWFGKCLWCI